MREHAATASGGKAARGAWNAAACIAMSQVSLVALNATFAGVRQLCEERNARPRTEPGVGREASAPLFS